MITAAVQALEDALADGLGSAAAVAVSTPAGRWCHATGQTRRWRRAPSGEWLDLPGQAVHADSLFDLASLTKPLSTLTLLTRAMAAEIGRAHV